MIRELREAGLIVELPGGTGTTWRYVIANKGKADLDRRRAEAGKEVKKQLELLAYYSELAGHKKTSASLRELTGRM